MDQAERQKLQDDLKRLADGDRKAFHPVFIALLPLLRRFTRRELPPGDAEDAAQEALMKVFLRASEFDPAREALPWVLGIAAYEIKTVRRRSARRREVEADPMRITARRDPAPTPEEQMIAADLDAALEAALDDLAPRDAATLRTFAGGGRPHDLPPATFRKRVERGLSRLRRKWRSVHGDR